MVKKREQIQIDLVVGMHCDDVDVSIGGGLVQMKSGVAAGSELITSAHSPWHSITRA